jgi:putative tricarboxylic transport membrane protein
MLKLEKITCIVWLSMGGLLFTGSMRLQIGTLSEPGPGFLPLLTGALLCGASLFHLFQLITQPASAAPPGHSWAGVHWQRGALIVGGLIAYALTVDFLGYLLSTFLLMLILFSLYDRKRWGVSIGGSLIVITVTYVVFCVWLKVQFPPGIFAG